MSLERRALVIGNDYKVTMNNFLADGGDSFPGFRAGTNRVNRPASTSMRWPSTSAATRHRVAPGPQNRITKLP